MMAVLYLKWCLNLCNIPVIPSGNGIVATPYNRGGWAIAGSKEILDLPIICQKIDTIGGVEFWETCEIGAPGDTGALLEELDNEGYHVVQLNSPPWI
jgi:hypothetical protein